MVSPWYPHGIVAQEELWSSQRLLGRSVEIRRDDPGTWTKDVAQPLDKGVMKHLIGI